MFVQVYPWKKTSERNELFFCRVQNEHPTWSCLNRSHIDAIIVYHKSQLKVHAQSIKLHTCLPWHIHILKAHMFVIRILH